MIGCIPFATAALTLPTESDVRLGAPLASSPAATIVLTLTDGFPAAPIARGVAAVPMTLRLLLPCCDSELTAPGWRLPVDSAVAPLLTSKFVSAVAPPAIDSHFLGPYHARPEGVIPTKIPKKQKQRPPEVGSR